MYYLGERCWRRVPVHERHQTKRNNMGIPRRLYSAEDRRENSLYSNMGQNHPYRCPNASFRHVLRS